MNTMSKRAIGLAGSAAAALALIAQPAGAQGPADFFKGKTINIVVSSAAGGGYDILSRTTAKYLASHTPGSPQFVVQNMPGAGGIVATNYIYSKAPKDGTAIGMFNNNTPFEPLFGTKQATYDATQFNWLGTPSIETGMLTIWHATPVNSWEELKTKEVTMGASGANSTPSFYARMMNETLGIKLKVIVGYPSQTNAFLAMERGELDGYASVFWSALKSVRPQWITENKVKLLVQFGLQPEPALTAKGVPFVLDLIKNPDDRKLMEAACAPLAAGRPFALPPGVPADRVAVMREAMIATFKDAAFKEEATKAGLDVDNIRTGEQLNELITRIYRDTPPAVVERLRKISQTE
jgi:tripartite-type tricarboxylate transporter receptor subunit TctC